MAKMAELNAELTQLLAMDQLFPPSQEDYGTALSLLLQSRKQRPTEVHPDQLPILHREADRV